jgi:hypothetical protein
VDVLALACAAACLGPVGFATAAIPPAPSTAAEMYEPGRIVAIELTLPQSSIEALEADPEGAYQPGTFSLAETDGTPAGVGEFSAPLDIGIRLKGSLGGSFRDLDGKAAFKLKFNEFVKGQKYLGLKKMTLNNMVQDPTMNREARSYEAFRALGLPAPNTGYAFVRVNGEIYGTYLNLETFDDVALEKRFGPFDDPQHLYEGSYGADVTPEREGKLEVDEGDEKVRADLEALTTAVAGGSAGWFERVSDHADLSEMARMWAVEKYSGHWDGYAGMAIDSLRPNNYYLYSDPDGRFQMLPWGTDQTWEEPIQFGTAGGTLFNGCLADAACEGIYRAAAAAALETIPSLPLDTATRCTAQRLKAFQALESDAREPRTPKQIADAVYSMREFILGRPAELAAFLGVPAPAAASDEKPCPPYVPEPIVRQPLTPSDRVESSVHLGNILVAGNRLVAHVNASAAGTAILKATFRTRRGLLRACLPEIREIRAGFGTLRCRLTHAARESLRSRWRRFKVTLLLVGSDGSSASDVRRVAAPRTLPRNP